MPNPALTAITSYCLSSILMTTTNKLVLSSYAFPLNFLLLAIQSTICVLMLDGFRLLGLIKRRTFKSEDAKKWFPISLLLTAMIYTGSKSLQHLPIPLFTIFKNLTIIIIAYTERAFFRGAPVSRLVLVSFFLMVLSSIIAAWADLSTGKANYDRHFVEDGASWFSIRNLVGYAWMASNCLTSAGFALGMKKRIREVGFGEFDTVFYNNLLSIPPLLISSLLTELPKLLSFSKTKTPPGLIFAILLSAISSFGISYSTAWCMRVTSSTTYSMVGALNKLPIAIAGMIFFDDPVTVGGVVGVLIAFLAGILYSHAKNIQATPPTPHRYASSDDLLPSPVNTKPERDRSVVYEKVASA